MAAAAAAAEDAAPTPERIAWAAAMRQKFSPPGMLNADGSINQEFFKPKRVVIMQEKKWGDAEREALHQGLEKHGVGRWREIGDEFLPAWDDQQIRIRASKMLGTQSLARYMGWKGDRAAVEAEYAKNRAIGEATGCWKNGTLVEDDSGSVKAYLLQQQQQQQQQQGEQQGGQQQQQQQQQQQEMEEG